MDNSGLVPQSHGGAIRPLRPGQTLNPGGAPRGKRVQTWMAEFGEMRDVDLPVIGSKEWDELPKNARIALRRLRAADAEEELGLANAKYVEPRELASGPASDGPALIQGIAAAIMALKAAGVELRPVIDVEGEKSDGW